MPLQLSPTPQRTRLIDENGFATPYFLQWMQKRDRELMASVTQQDQIITDLGNQLDAIQAAQDAADAANAAAAAADTAATNAQSAADGALASTALTNSYVSGVTITASDAGASATITISAHTRHYADGTSVSVSGGTVTGLSYSTRYFIYYDQASRAGGSVTYVATTSQATAAQVGDRHTVGDATTPASGGANIDGDYVLPPGVGNIN
jgi:hypothetical protein